LIRDCHIIETLIDSKRPRRYWSDLKIKIQKEGAVELYEKIILLKLESSDGKMREIDALDAFEKRTASKVVTSKNYK
jgi:hypothetical protein